MLPNNALIHSNSRKLLEQNQHFFDNDAKAPEFIDKDVGFLKTDANFQFDEEQALKEVQK